MDAEIKRHFDLTDTTFRNMATHVTQLMDLTDARLRLATQEIEVLTHKLATLEAKIKALCDQTQTPARDESQ